MTSKRNDDAPLAHRGGKVVRHEEAPEPNACRWCGVLQYGHGLRFTRSIGVHPFVEPTDAQRKARMRARRKTA